MTGPEPVAAEHDGHDLRMPVVGVAAWLAGIAAYHGGDRAGVAVVGAALVAALAARTVGLDPARRRLLAAAGVVAIAVVASTLLRHHGTATNPLARFAEQRVTAVLRATVTADPRVVPGQWGDRVVVRLRANAVTARDTTYHLGGAVVLFGGEDWRAVALGEEVRVEGRLRSADDPGTAAVITSGAGPVRIRGPDPWWRGAEAVRAALRDSVAPLPTERRALVPALVVGDVSAMPPELEADFRTTGLTHLTAVSGTNLTLLLGFVLLVARSLGVRGRWLHLVALLGIAGFVLLTRTEPSVVRAAAMGVVGLFALGTDGRRRGMRALGVAVTVLLLVWPPLAVSVGFALSVLATGGIVLAGPPITRGLARWLPQPLAQAVAVPLAAQVAVSPVIAALSGEVSLVAVLANVVVAPVVGPATVLGLAGGLGGLAWTPLGRAAGWLAGWCVAWIVAVAGWGADLPRAAVGWGTGPVAVAALVATCLVVLVLAPRLARHPRVAAAVALATVLVVVDVPGRVVPWPGRWPPDWVLVACDVGQGDALAIRTGPGAAVVVDAGPEPDDVDACLERLGVTDVPLVVLTHFHADHVDGLAGVLAGRRVGAVAVSPVADPPDGAAQVEQVAAEHGVPVGVASYGRVARYGATSVQVLGPVPGAGDVVVTGDGSAANDGSVVLLVESRGVRMLLTGDVEPAGQAAVARAAPGLAVDVLKVPHHGSRHQDEGWLASLGAEVALVPVGRDNDYGHPDPGLLAGLADDGVVVGRTDTGGDLAVVVEDGRTRLLSRE